MSILAPKWLKTNPFYPTWMGSGVEIDVVIGGTGEGGAFLHPIYDKESPKLSISVSGITFRQKGLNSSVDSFVSYKEISKLK